MNTKRCILLFLFLPAFWSAVAQPSLDECREMARNNYPAIRRYALIEQTRSYSLANAALAWVPQIALQGQATWQNKVPAFPEQMTAMLAAAGTEMPGMEKDQYRVAVDISQTLWDGGQSRAERAVAKAEAEEQLRSLDVELYEVESRVDELYFGILLLDNRIDQTKEMIGLLDNNLEKVRSFVRNGVAMASDADMLEAEKLSAGQSLAQLQASRDSYRIMLGHFIGQEIEPDLRLRLPPSEEPTLLTINRPELDWIDAKIDLLDAQSKWVNTSALPRFSLFGQGFYGYPGFDYFASMQNHDWSWNALVGVRMVWNVSSLYTLRNNRQKIRAAQDIARVQKDVFLFNNSLLTDRQGGEIARLRKALADDNRIVELRTAVRQAAESRFHNGVMDTYELLQKITDENAALLSRSIHETELLKALYELKHTVNSKHANEHENIH
jgi:outer membrane protein TolC